MNERKPLLKRGLGPQAAEVIRSNILSGMLKPGEQITEESLSTQFGLSRGTIRTAMQQLVYEGLIRYEPYKGNYVQSLSAHDAWEIYTLRNTLEALATRLATEKMTAAGRERLTQALTKLKKAIESTHQSEIVDADFALHQIIFELSQHQRLLAQYSQLQSLTKLYMNVVAGYRFNLDDLAEEHQTLVDAIISGEVEKAAQIAQNHNVLDGEYLIQELNRQ